MRRRTSTATLARIRQARTARTKWAILMEGTMAAPCPVIAKAQAPEIFGRELAAWLAGVVKHRRSDLLRDLAARIDAMPKPWTGVNPWHFSMLSFALFNGQPIKRAEWVAWTGRTPPENFDFAAECRKLGLRFKGVKRRKKHP